MRIVDLQTFLAMPAGTVFAKYRPCVFGDLHIKGDTLASGTDFFYQQIVDALDVNDSGEFADELRRATRDGATGPEIAMDFNCEGRDALFDADQLFAVWSRDDVAALIERLTVALQQANACACCGKPRVPGLHDDLPMSD